MGAEDYYPPANRAHQRFDLAHPGAAMGPVEKVVWHSTETGGWPGYEGGAIAPHMTGMPDTAGRRISWRAHFPARMNARALKNAPGGVQTNLDGAFQIELVGTCDPARKNADGAMFLPAAPAWYLDALAEFAVWAHTAWGVPLVCPTFQAYPASYGPRSKTNNVRMSFQAWDAYRGHCGHQHVPENVHGDPGALNLVGALALAHTKIGAAIVAELKPADMWTGAGVDLIPHNQVTDPTKPTNPANPTWRPVSILEEDNRLIRQLVAGQTAQAAQITALTTSVQSLVSVIQHLVEGTSDVKPT
jgi:hypothetical protein